VDSATALRSAQNDGCFPRKSAMTLVHARATQKR
jgi:hypothetical protein